MDWRGLYRLAGFTVCGTTWKGYATKRSSESRITRIFADWGFVRIADYTKSTV